MSKQSLLLVDGDTRSLRVLEVSLRKAGFMVTAATSVQDALDKLELHAPDLIISETTFPDGDGFELRRRVRATPEWAEIPFIFLTAEAAIENKIRGLELGVDDYLTKPIYIKEIVTRINILLQKRQRARFEERRDGRTRFAGRVQDMPVVDVIQTIEISRKSGVIQFVGERGRQAAIYFRDGRVIDAEAGSLQGEDAVYRLLTWSEGEFEVVFRTVRRREVIATSSQGLLMEGMRRLDEWSRLFEQLPPLTHRFEVDTIELAARLGDVPDDNNLILRLFDGKRTLLEVIDASDVGDLECLQAISRLYFEELLLDLDHDSTPRRDTGKAIQLVELDTPMPIEEVASGPIADESSGPIAADTGEVEAEAANLESAAEGAPGMVTDPGVAAGAEVPEAEGPPFAAGAAGFDLADLGPLMGGYRPSSLRLIDEAVAAAQAIEPSLFDDGAAGGGGGPGAGGGVDGGGGVPGHSGNGVSRLAAGAGAAEERAYPMPTVDVAADAAAMSTARDAGVASEATSPGAAPGREESGLRMIGSLGRDRAEASGELAPVGTARPRRSETARELVTILPRRITREVPLVTPAPVPASSVVLPEPRADLAESLPTPTPTSPMLAPKPAVAPAIELPALPPPALPRVSLPGSGVRAPSRSRRILRIMRAVDRNGPGLGPLLLILLAVVLAGTAVLLRMRRQARVSDRVQVIDEGQPPAAAMTLEPWIGTPDAIEGAAVGSGGAPPQGAARPDPTQGLTGPSATGRDAARPETVQDAARPDPAQEPTGSGTTGNAARPEAGRDGAQPGATRDGAQPDATRDGTRPGATRDGAQPGATRDGAQPGATRDGTQPGATREGAQPDATREGARPGATRDGTQPGATPEGAQPDATRDGAQPGATRDGARPEAGRGDATGRAPVRPDPGLRVRPPRAAGTDAGADKIAEAKVLYDKANDALEEGDFARALELAEASLKLRRTARTFLLRAQAQQRLDRVDDALASVDTAERLAPGFSAVWEMRGRILWAARRRDEARAAFEKFLELDPNSPKAPAVRRLMNEPR